MYGIFTYKTGWFLGQMLVNIPYMEHMGMIVLSCAIKGRNVRWRSREQEPRSWGFLVAQLQMTCPVLQQWVKESDENSTGILS